MKGKNKSTLKGAIDAFLEKEMYPHQYVKDGGHYLIEMYADYSDEMPAQTVAEILESDGDPMDAFHDELMNQFQEDEWAYQKELLKKCKEYLKSEDCGEYPNGLTSDDEETARDYLLDEKVFFATPKSHYLNKSYDVPIMIDTGDGNYDYTLNAVYPHHNSQKGETISDCASIVWLTKRQGYRKTDLNRALRHSVFAAESAFLRTLTQEVANLSSHMGCLTYLVKMTLGELIQLNRLIRLQSRNGAKDDARERPRCGFIELSKGTTVGLYDACYGSGSLFEIECEEHHKIPVKFIRSALPDGCGGGYGVDNVYGFTDKVWSSGKVLCIHEPRNVEKLIDEPQAV